VPATLIAVATDRLVPPDLMRQLSNSLAGPCELVEINSLYGHDAFLKEPEVLTPILTQALNKEVAA
jgi:homoserine O-acetyltransferase